MSISAACYEIEKRAQEARETGGQEAYDRVYAGAIGTHIGAGTGALTGMNIGAAVGGPVGAVVGGLVGFFWGAASGSKDETLGDNLKRAGGAVAGQVTHNRCDR